MADALFWDHPRVRGEHRKSASTRPRPRGSSPRARGTPAIHIITQVFLGIIPACAGNTERLQFDPAGGGDHPRVRGEHDPVIYTDLNDWGSSPRARGTLQTDALIDLDAGIIPACAGNTNFFRGIVQGSGDHPRVRGEHRLLCLLV